MMQIKCFSNGLYSLKNSHNAFGPLTVLFYAFSISEYNLAKGRVVIRRPLFPVARHTSVSLTVSSPSGKKAFFVWIFSKSICAPKPQYFSGPTMFPSFYCLIHFYKRNIIEVKNLGAGLFNIDHKCFHHAYYFLPVLLLLLVLL